ncbi:hypothetical protein BD410DRAFT_781456, partial [Rickenella mellea]
RVRKREERIRFSDSVPSIRLIFHKQTRRSRHMHLMDVVRCPVFLCNMASGNCLRLTASV